MKPTNQASLASLVVPVLPASGWPSTLAASAGAALDHALQHVDHLVGVARVLDLLALVGNGRRRLAVPGDVLAAGAGPLVAAQDGAAVAVLDALDQGRARSACRR